MNTFNKFLSVSLVALGVSACSTKPDLQMGFEPGSCRFNFNKEQAPDWYCAPHELFPDGAWYEKGTGHASLADHNVQYTVALQNARAELSRRARVHVEESFKQVLTTEGTTDAQHAEIARNVVTKITTDVVLPPTYKHAETYDSQGNLYVLIKVDEKLLLKKLKEKESALMREFNVELKRKGLEKVSAEHSQADAEPIPST
jgi:hypothetical protein